jgi:hypothetical protein
LNPTEEPFKTAGLYSSCFSDSAATEGLSTKVSKLTGAKPIDAAMVIAPILLDIVRFFLMFVNFILDLFFFSLDFCLCPILSVNFIRDLTDLVSTNFFSNSEEVFELIHTRVH